MAQESLRALLAGLVDYAGLFPPAQLSMAESVRNYAGYLRGDDAWVLGRFVVPMARLDEFLAAAAPHLGVAGIGPWRLAALAPPDFADGISTIAAFNERQGGARIDTLEWKPGSPDEIEPAGRLIPPGLNAFFEIPAAADPSPFVEAIAAAGGHAKIRTGGMTPELVPPIEQILAFLEACDRSNVAFKATAGLHHPIRAVQPLTYQPDSPRCKTHGFLNVFLAAAFLRTGVPAADIAELLAEESPASFSFNRGGASWRAYWMSSKRIRTARERFAIAFGSCSFEEPLADLREAGLL